MRDEDKFGILPEPDTTCQYIDKEIKNLNDKTTELNNSVEDGFELIRKYNEELRAWGDAWKTKCLEVSADLEKAQDKLSEVEEENENLKNEVIELQDELDNLS